MKKSRRKKKRYELLWILRKNVPHRLEKYNFTAISSSFMNLRLFRHELEWAGLLMTQESPRALLRRNAVLETGTLGATKLLALCRWLRQVWSLQIRCPGNLADCYSYSLRSTTTTLLANRTGLTSHGVIFCRLHLSDEEGR